MMKALGIAGEFAAVWSAIGACGAALDQPRRGRWLVAAATGPAAVGFNFAVKVAVGRQRPLIEEHPPLATAPTKLSFPSAHATSSVAAATALGRVERRARLPLLTLAGLICVGRPYLGMHYPSDVLGGAMLGMALGTFAPGLGPRPTEDRLIDLAIDANRRGERNGVPEDLAPVEPGSRRA
jgi:membrane-associated phospholipid phosphatase